MHMLRCNLSSNICILLGEKFTDEASADADGRARTITQGSLLNLL